MDSRLSTHTHTHTTEHSVIDRTLLSADRLNPEKACDYINGACLWAPTEHPMADCKLPYRDPRGQCSSRNEARVRAISSYLHPQQGAENPRTNANA
ncbi:hypothetical protein EVAR_2294_1 [Eumeta japonica]|uniref:Uncharacterized protein n=1 Tax=Eumeta variegata TaxID=151549 RepID=A0A4C1SG76_EUMVA|nr:hypothetical protein EVAR_2294_1 [Eumeta japonica]